MKIIPSSPEEHDDFGCSKHPMFCKCPAFHQSGEENEHMRKGTFKHTLANCLFNGTITEEEVLNDPVHEYYKGEFNDQDRQDVIKATDMLGMAYDWFVTQTDSENVTIMDEVSLDMSNLGLKYKSTPDLVFVGDLTHILIADFKFGNKFVNADSPQLLSLLTKLVKQYPSGRIFSCIIQPRVKDEPLILEQSRDVIELHERKMQLILSAAKSDDPPQCPNQYCDWCDKNPCAAVKAQIAVMHNNSDLPSIETMDALELAKWAFKARKLKDIAGSLDQEIVRRLQLGEKVPGHYMSDPIERRQYIEEELATQILMQCVDIRNKNKKSNQEDVSYEDLFIPKKLKGISDAEKVIGKSAAVAEVFQRAVVKKQTSPQLRFSENSLLEAINERK